MTHTEQKRVEEIAAGLTRAQRVEEIAGKANREAIALIDEINLRSSSRAFYGIDQVLHAKLCTIRATLVRTHLQGQAQ
jgi:hypothetical protein